MGVSGQLHAPDALLHKWLGTPRISLHAVKKRKVSFPCCVLNTGYLFQFMVQHSSTLCNIPTENDLSYLGHFQEVPQAMPALLSSPQQSNETCQQPTLSTNDLLLAMSCSVSGEPLHLVTTRETLLRRARGSNQPTNKASCTMIHYQFLVAGSSLSSL